MAESDAQESRLEDLRRRWQAEPDSRLYLQLAEEYRRLNRSAEAAEVLEQGLERRPNDLSGRVALGRCRLETAEVEKAGEALSMVVARDPAHLVANKLLLEVHLLQGEAEPARKRLETYRLLNDRDPEIDHLEYRLQRLTEDGSEPETVSSTPATAVSDEDLPESGIPSVSSFGSATADEPGVEATAPAAAPEPVAASESQDMATTADPAASPPLAAATSQIEGIESSRELPFPGLHGASLQDIRQHLGAGGVFALEANAGDEEGSTDPATVAADTSAASAATGSGDLDDASIFELLDQPSADDSAASSPASDAVASDASASDTLSSDSLASAAQTGDGPADDGPVSTEPASEEPAPDTPAEEVSSIADMGAVGASPTYQEAQSLGSSESGEEDDEASSGLGAAAAGSALLAGAGALAGALLGSKESQAEQADEPEESAAELDLSSESPSAGEPAEPTPDELAAALEQDSLSAESASSAVDTSQEDADLAALLSTGAEATAAEQVASPESASESENPAAETAELTPVTAEAEQADAERALDALPPWAVSQEQEVDSGEAAAEEPAAEAPAAEGTGAEELGAEELLAEAESVTEPTQAESDLVSLEASTPLLDEDAASEHAVESASITDTDAAQDADAAQDSDAAQSAEAAQTADAAHEAGADSPQAAEHTERVTESPESGVEPAVAAEAAPATSGDLGTQEAIEVPMVPATVRAADVPPTEELELWSLGVPDAPPLEVDDQEAPTATLAGLYLQQGHLDEAEQIFRQLLERESDAAVARRGLAEIERRRAGSVTAAQLLAVSAKSGQDEGEPAPHKTRMLRAYLERLRAGG